MRVIVAGDIRKAPLLDTNSATAVLISTDDGKPTVIFKMMSNGRGWIRLVKGEDPNFDEQVKELGLT